ncbi:MAG TPA: 2-amino-4-oxopentanoate thiolase subunit OrtB [Bacillota bacterium]|nr:PLP-dependent lyase/thiolase [Candidatus Fermentithermobacillaceae bacterium]HOB31207.1 2-amino-4-oxopentanoate thiolase subunit OrtB [Bacillota bacterium]HOQ03533.1 2-amino-4-oxopentanoate thiolase subunit OrtB [Bacillota bacterium]HPV13922.1 2-amino-4-oxopentanoate thiolase subunit OrtB [Bacillota bacterium]HPZ78832.1 2-amino-4-oxopentanoate thiolase subunit OrtB [Bacillota bacterium]
MARDTSYDAVMERRAEIMSKALGLDYDEFVISDIAFDYEGMMERAGYSLEEVRKIQAEAGVGNTPLLELRNITDLVRQTSKKGYGARILVKDEAANPSGSFKDRRASVSIYHAKKLGYPGVLAATSGNYGAAVASQAAMKNLGCIIVQEVFDSRHVGQPEIIEKSRKCEAYGAEVVQLTVGPELFYVSLILLEETGYFNASLYSPFGISGVETLGYELIEQVRSKYGKDPAYVVVTHAGGGNVTGTARGVLKAGAKATKIIGASVDLSGLHMASDNDFNKKSFTTGHTGFGVPFATWPDRTDVPKNAARPLRYLDRYVTVTQGEVFYVTEALAQVEGLERGPAGNTSLAAAIALARELPEDEIVVVQETEYTGAGKHPWAQLDFAKQNGIIVKRGDPKENVPGKNIVIPEDFSQISITEMDLNRMRRSYIRNAVERNKVEIVTEKDIQFLAEDTKTHAEFVISILRDLGVNL